MVTQMSKGAAQGQSAPGSDPAEFVDRFESAWAKSDPDALAELLTDDVVLIQPIVPDTAGKTAAREQFSRLLRFIPDLHTTVDRWAAQGDILFIEFTLSGTFGGRDVSWPAVDRFLLRDGLAAERVSYFDSSPLALTIMMRPRGWRRLLRSGFRPSLPTTTSDRRRG
jgi:ketosteroid isomerase-like protein